jgi:hypothetical protein
MTAKMANRVPLKDTPERARLCTRNAQMDVCRAGNGGVVEWVRPQPDPELGLASIGVERLSRDGSGR